jgi:hypothetical protein
MHFIGLSGTFVSFLAVVAARSLPERRGVLDVFTKILAAEKQWQKELVNTSYVLSGDSTTANGYVIPQFLTAYTFSL